MEGIQIMTTTHDNGGQLHPTTEFYDEQPTGVRLGATLWDHYAGQALQGVTALLSPAEVNQLADGIKGGAIPARAAATLADAMIAERTKRMRRS